MPTVTYTIKYPRSSESKRERERKRAHATVTVTLYAGSNKWPKECTHTYADGRERKRAHLNINRALLFPATCARNMLGNTSKPCAKPKVV